MRRRRLLATGGALLAGALAGCGHTNQALVMDAVDDAGIADRASSGLPDEDTEYRRIVSATIENGSATANGSYPPVDPDRAIAHEGAYYEVTHTVVGSRTVTSYSIEVDFDPESTDGPTVAFEELPRVDREALSELIPPGEGHPTGEGTDMGFGRTYTDDEENRSVLVPTTDYEYVSYEGTSYGIVVGEPRETTVDEYRYTAERVATSATAFARQLKDEYLFVLAGLSDDERTVVEKAIDDGYYGGGPDEGFRSLVDRFRQRTPVIDRSGDDDDYVEAQYLVSYEGTVYWTDVYSV